MHFNHHNPINYLNRKVWNLDRHIAFEEAIGEGKGGKRYAELARKRAEAAEARDEISWAWADRRE